MKKTTVLAGALIISVSVLCFNGLGRAAEPEALMAKEIVSKVLKANSFTPPVQIPGPRGVTFYVGCRSITPLVAEQAIVAVSGGKDFSVEVAAFRREKPDQPWTAMPKGHLATQEQNMKEQMTKNLAMQEKAATPETK